MGRLVMISLACCILGGCSEGPPSPASEQGRNETREREGQLFRDGDLVFQVSMSAQCEAIQAATGSQYAHCGVIHFVNGVPHVLEAVQPVRSIPFERWVGNGRNGHFVVKRVHDTDILTPEVLGAMFAEGRRMLGKNYDPWFSWSDKEIYCSELIWKIYKRGAALELCEPRELQEFDLSSPVVRTVMAQRYGDRVPLQEPMVSPGDLFDSALLIEVHREGRP